MNLSNPELSLEEYINDPQEFRPPHDYETPGWSTGAECYVLSQAARLVSETFFENQKPPCIIEVGALAGKTTEAFIAGAEAANGAVILVIDPFEESSEQLWISSLESPNPLWAGSSIEAFRKTMQRSMMIPQEGDSWKSKSGNTTVHLIRKHSEDSEGVYAELKRIFGENMPQSALCFVDGSHALQIVGIDLRHAEHGFGETGALKVRNGGILAIHDTGGFPHPGPAIKSAGLLLGRQSKFFKIGQVDTLTLARRVGKLSKKEWLQNVQFILTRQIKGLRGSIRVLRPGVGNIKPVA